MRSPIAANLAANREGHEFYSCRNRPKIRKRLQPLRYAVAIEWKTNKRKHSPRRGPLRSDPGNRRLMRTTPRASESSDDYRDKATREASASIAKKFMSASWPAPATAEAGVVLWSLNRHDWKSYPSRLSRDSGLGTRDSRLGTTCPRSPLSRHGKKLRTARFRGTALPRFVRGSRRCAASVRRWDC